MAIITGAGSKWINAGDFFVGYKGSGAITVSDGGLLSTKTLYASLSDLYGNGTIIANGAILDADLVFDSNHGLTQTLAFGSGGSLQLAIDGTGGLGAGHKRSGSLRIVEGRVVTSAGGFLGLNSGSMGTATVTGAGSKWISSGELDVGGWGSGILQVEAGGQVRSTSNDLPSVLGSYAGTGTAVITGVGSKWTNAGELLVGRDAAAGRLMVSDGGQVTANVLSINSQSTVRLHVSGDRMVLLGNTSTVGSLRNSGKLSFLADAFLPAGNYRPLREHADRNFWWSDNKSILTVGGTCDWDDTTLVLAVIKATSVNAGASAPVATGKRLLITDPSTGDRLGLSFGTLTSGATLTARPANPTERAALLRLLQPHERIVDAWDFTGPLAGDEALVSFDAGLGTSNLRLWRLSQDGWTAYTPDMLTYDAHGIVSFTVDPASLSGSAYAVTAIVPEPATLGLLALASLTVLTRRHSRPTP